MMTTIMMMVMMMIQSLHDVQTPATTADPSPQSSLRISTSELEALSLPCEALARPSALRRRTIGLILITAYTCRPNVLFRNSQLGY